MKIIFIANNTIGSGMSGGDRIWINFIKYWENKIDINLICSEEAHNMLKREFAENGLESMTISDKKIPLEYLNIRNLFKYQIKRIFKGVKAVYSNLKIIKKSTFIYSASDFYPDIIPAFFAKIIYRKIKWIAGYYLIAPSPIGSKTPYKKNNRLKGLMYWMMQRTSLFIVKHFADYVFVTSEPDVKNFISKKLENSKIIIIKGGIYLQDSRDYINRTNIISVEKRKYDACFVGRFHVQKGILELIDIWNILNSKINNKKLAIIGDGELKEEIEDKINKYNLNKNIEILGFLDGEDKYEIFRNSKMILHPAIFDSGGMAMAEGMAFGLPGISFDLEALKSYYPKGVLKITCFDLESFANTIIKLLEDSELYAKFSGEAYEYAKTWDWKVRADSIFHQLINNLI